MNFFLIFEQEYILGGFVGDVYSCRFCRFVIGFKIIVKVDIGFENGLKVEDF